MTQPVAAARRNRSAAVVVGTVTAMKVAALVFYIVGFALQMVGAYLVIQDVRTSIGNMRRLKSGLADADEAAAEHRRQITEMANKPRPFGLDVAMSQLADLLAGVAVEQTPRSRETTPRTPDLRHRSERHQRPSPVGRGRSAARWPGCGLRRQRAVAVPL